MNCINNPWVVSVFELNDKKTLLVEGTYDYWHGVKSEKEEQILQPKCFPLQPKTFTLQPHRRWPRDKNELDNHMH